MISFMISEVPAKMRMTRASVYRRLTDTHPYIRRRREAARNVRHFPRQLGRQQFGFRRQFRCQPAGIVFQHALVDEGLHGVELGPHLGHHEARVLESADGLPECPALLDELQCQIERGLAACGCVDGT